VVTIHDPEPHEGMERPVYNFLKKWIQVQWGNRFLVHGPATEKAAIKKGYPQNRVHVIPHGLHDQYPEPCHHRFRDLNNQILIFGTIRPNKGYDKIPELVDEVAEEVPSVTAVVAGSADTAAQIDSTWINGIKERLRAHPRIELDEGFVSAENVKCLFKESKVVLLPYTDASQSGVAMLARTLHRPVVSTRTGDLPQAIDHGYTGFLREPCDTGGIALMVAELLTNRRTWCQFVKNIERTNEAFRWDRVVNRVRAIYHTLPD
jgi:glycosyltransferase involved in cell wall biosynthesis